MKVRHGFVSNSSTSSFLCDICGRIEAERDLCLADTEMTECQNGHTLCIDHMDENPFYISRSIEEKKKILLDSNFAEDIKEDMDDEDIEDLYDEWKSEARYELPPTLCPLCMLKLVTDRNLLLYLFKTMNMSREEIVGQICEKYATYDDFDSFIKA